ncbi:hypothetical protein A1O3_09855 [Capronia epimyces CBS 606.96]|uniref:Impact N-terminal domain-containing protein n=1 Tax=Capronia epimyces CBS 606.96 TaxID=1182542 RepID=W9XAV6_9EURO|nr:uncharacterized protein A1O3_09855 [Capronia epimyces CBS 606.96]EXJ77627.1 hypothetical protein A1O3_09855 [Capronia epimyces CBS 606.96]
MAAPRAPKRTLEEEEDDEALFTSAPVVDRSSTFVAHFHPHIFTSSRAAGATTSSTSLTSMIKSLQAHPAFATADHRMAAWRRPSGQRTLVLGTATTTTTNSNRVIYTTGSDDDGEKYAGKRLERVLDDLNVQGALVVARWYGGIMLGPVRFTHMENVAKEAIAKWKSQTQAQAPWGTTGTTSTALSISHNDRADKRQKAAGAEGTGIVQQQQQNEAERLRLAKQLLDRDNSIVVLRGLLAEKTAAASASTSKQDAPLPLDQSQSQKTETASSPAKKVIDYTEMPLQRLRQLDKARDATLAFILKQLDKADQEEKERERVKLRTTTLTTGTDTYTNTNTNTDGGKVDSRQAGQGLIPADQTAQDDEGTSSPAENEAADPFPIPIPIAHGTEEQHQQADETDDMAHSEESTRQQDAAVTGNNGNGNMEHVLQVVEAQQDGQQDGDG